MSYLDFPRIHFAGQFTTGPSTINNTPSNFNTAAPLGNLLWNPDGPAYFQLSGCTVQSVVLPNRATDPTDTLVGQTLISPDNWGGSKVPAKIVDLDPQQQMVSMLYGLQLQIGEGDNSVIVDYEPMWFQDYPISAAYQSILVRPKWGSDITSKTLQSLQQISPDLLSIKFVVGSPSFTGPPESRCVGQIIGTIGPAKHDQPINFVKGRLLRPVGAAENLNFGPAIVRDRLLTIDLLNAIPWRNNTAPNIGTLEVSFTVPKGPTYSLGVFNYTANARQTRALVQDFDLNSLTEAEYNLLLNSPISVGNDPQIATFQEDASGLYVNATPYVFRMEANTQAKVHIWAGRFGVGQEGLEIAVKDETSQLLGRSEPPVVGVAPTGTPLTFTPGTGKTDANGNLTVTLDGGNPNNPRGYIDGQVYALRFHTHPPIKHPNPETFLSILVHNEFNLPPTWESIKPIMEQYARLYPYMSFVPLIDPEALVAGGWIPKLIQVFSYPIEDPRYMPVVRDLSTAKQNAIVTWLNSQLTTEA